MVVSSVRPDFEADVGSDHHVGVHEPRPDDCEKDTQDTMILLSFIEFDYRGIEFATNSEQF
jgi:hypothetical protein